MADENANDLAAGEGRRLERWDGALRQYRVALEAYAEALGRGGNPDSPAARLPPAAAEGPAPPPASLEGSALAAAALEVIEARAAAAARLDAAAAALLDPKVGRAAARRMSRTFVDGLGRLRKRLGAAADEAHAADASAGLAAAWAARIATAAPGGVAFPASRVGSVLAAAVLRVWAERGESEALARVGAELAEKALGAPSAESTEDAIRGRAGLHALQAMGISFGLGPNRGSQIEPLGGLYVDATLPQANAAVRYNLDALINPRAAAQFGAVGTVYSGLSYRVVERLRTIVETPIDRAADAAAPGAGAAGHKPPPGRIRVHGAADPLWRSVDGGKTFQGIRGPLPNAAYEAVGAGPSPRLSRLAGLLEEAVGAAPIAPAQSAGAPVHLADSEEFNRHYATRVEEARAATPRRDALVQELSRRFGGVLRRLAPATPFAFRAAVLGEGETRDIYRTYIAESLSAVAARRADQAVARSEALSSSAVLFGGRAEAAREAAKEHQLSAFTQIWGAVKAVRHKLAQAYEALNADAIAERALARKGAGGAQDLLTLQTKLVREALMPREQKTRVVEKMGSVDPRPSLKTFLLERGDVSARAR